MSDVLKLPALFVALTLPLVLVLSFIVPPFQAPDEMVHYYHARMIANGDVLPIEHENRYLGGQIEQGDIDLPKIFDKLKFQPDVKVTRSDLNKAASLNDRTLQWEDLGLGPSYPPTAYMAASAGLWMGDLLHLDRLRTYYLGRVLNSIVYVLIGALAIYFTPVGKGFFALILMLPMSTFEAASFSSDVHTTAFTALLVALMAREALKPRSGHGMLILMAGILLSLANTKLFLIFLLIPLAWLAYRRSLAIALSYSAAIILVFSIWSIVYIFHDIQAAKMATLPGVSPSGQLQYLFMHPMAVFNIAVNTLSKFGVDYALGLIGILGWLDTFLAKWYYVFAVAVIVAATLLNTNSMKIGNLRIALFIASVLGAGAIFGLLYLSWTEVGADTVKGVQGRYFIPLLFPMVVSLSGLSSLRIKTFGAEIALIVAFGIVSHPQVVRTIVDRYYLQ